MSRTVLGLLLLMEFLPGCKRSDHDHGNVLPREMHVRAGYAIQQIYRVPADQGSWIAMAVDDKGRLITADQYGGLFRVTLDAPGSTGVAAVDKLDSLGIGGAHGLLFANGSLYVMVTEHERNRFGGGEPGFYRMLDTDGDDRFDQVELLREIEGNREHGAHGMVLNPSRSSIYYVNGNETKLPKDMEKQVPVAWGEDHIVPRMWPPVGSGRGALAPAGYVGRTDLDGFEHELLAIGLRNCYRLAFDPNGELFTHDSDTENELGTPWYLPTRIIHVVSGADYGWRSGSGRWPPEYPDSLPGVVDTGPGSPTGVVMGTGARFPERYQRALFVADWTYGTIYAVHLVPEGATFGAEREEFASGSPLPITDLLVHPDGSMYFIVGGRLSESALFRIDYVGSEPTAAVSYPEPTPEALLRKDLEMLHADGTGVEAVDKAWDHLGHSDRFVRWAARVAIERQPTDSWAARALAEDDVQTELEAMLALVRVGPASLQPEIIQELMKLDLAALAPNQQHHLVRLWQLTFTRMGAPTEVVRCRLVSLLEKHFPTENLLLNRELVGLLIYLKSPTIVAKTVALLEKPNNADEPNGALDTEHLIGRNERYGATIVALNEAQPDRQQIAYATALRAAEVGWTPELRRRYVSWFNRAYRWNGGISFDLFINNIRAVALAGVTDPNEREQLASISIRPPPSFLSDAVVPEGPGRIYTLDEAVAVVAGHLKGRDFDRGRSLYIATGCVSCHRMRHLGVGAAGPMLNRAGSRYSERDLLQAIIDPSASVNENYAATQYEMKDGSVIVGYPAYEEGGVIFVVTNLLAVNASTPIQANNVERAIPYPHSLMPPGLINALNEEELRDLVAFVLGGGDPDDAIFKQ